MQKRLSGNGAHSIEVELVDMALLQTRDDEVDSQSVCGEGGFGDDRCGSIDLWTAVEAPVVMSEGAHHEGVRGITGSERTRYTIVDSRIA